MRFKRSCFAAGCLALLLALPAAASAVEVQGLYILTPRAPRAVKLCAYHAAVKNLSDNGLEVEVAQYLPDGREFWADYAALDGDLDGPMVWGDVSYTPRVGRTVGQPFTCYDREGKPLDNRYWFARMSYKQEVWLISRVGIYSKDDGMRVVNYGGSESNYPLGETSRIIKLAANPSIRPDNPLVLYLTDAGMGGVTLDGQEAFAFGTKVGYCDEEVILLTKELHARRPKGIQEGEEVICISQWLTEEELKDPYLTYEALGEEERKALETGFEELGYRLEGLDFRRATSPKYLGENCYEAQERIALEGGGEAQLRVTYWPDAQFPVKVVGATAAVVLGDDKEKMTVNPGDTRADIAAWAEKEILLRKQKNLMIERMEDSLSLPGGYYYDYKLRPVDDAMRANLGSYGEQYAGEGYYALRKELNGSQRAYTLYAVARFEEGIAEKALETAYYVCYKFQDAKRSPHDLILRAEDGENIFDLLNRLRGLEQGIREQTEVKKPPPAGPPPLSFAEGD